MGQMDSRERVKSCSTFPFFGCFDNVRRLRDAGGRLRVVVNSGSKLLPSKPTDCSSKMALHCEFQFSAEPVVR